MDAEAIMKKLEDLQKTIIQSKEELMAEIVGRVSKLEEKTRLEVEEVRRENEELKTRVNELEQYSIKNDVIICGIKESKNESEKELVEKIVETAKKLKTELEPREIMAIHRLPTKKKDIARPIIVRLQSLRKKEELRRKSKEVRLDKIFVNEHLSQNSRVLLGKARELREEGYWKFSWFNNGHVMIRQDENSGAMRIRNLEDLYRIKNQMDQEEEEARGQEQAGRKDEGSQKKERSTTRQKGHKLATTKQQTLDQFKNSITISTRSHTK